MSAPPITLAHLTPAEAAHVEAGHPELGGGAHGGEPQEVLAIRAAPAVVELLEQVVAQFARSLHEGDEQAAKVLDALTPEVGAHVLSPERYQQLWHRGEARRHFLETVELLSSAMVGERGGSSARNASALASRWKGEGRIFAVPNGRADCFPAFQFDELGQPRPEVAAVLRALPPGTEWARALWWTAPNGWLNGQRPVDLFAGDAEAVIAAAHRTAAPIEP
ncbi:MAG: hypothetical protein KJT01_10850 [Gemmatimonadetes bacterium]|nr:hypothetical protein [Gemmatimonadota bacterium]